MICSFTELCRKQSKRSWVVTGTRAINLKGVAAIMNAVESGGGNISSQKRGAASADIKMLHCIIDYYHSLLHQIVNIFLK